MQLDSTLRLNIGKKRFRDACISCPLLLSSLAPLTARLTYLITRGGRRKEWERRRSTKTIETFVLPLLRYSPEQVNNTTSASVRKEIGFDFELLPLTFFLISSLESLVKTHKWLWILRGDLFGRSHLRVQDVLT